MRKKDKYYIDSNPRDVIRSIMYEYIDLKKYEVFLFWSRVKGKYRPSSDWDIWVYWNDLLPRSVRRNIMLALEEIPYTVDFVDFSQQSTPFFNTARQSSEVL